MSNIVLLLFNFFFLNFILEEIKGRKDSRCSFWEDERIDFARGIFIERLMGWTGILHSLKL